MSDTTETAQAQADQAEDALRELTRIMYPGDHAFETAEPTQISSLIGSSLRITRHLARHVEQLCVWVNRKGDALDLSEAQQIEDVIRIARDGLVNAADDLEDAWNPAEAGWGP